LFPRYAAANLCQNDMDRSAVVGYAAVNETA
jgi:hypothetical protein